MRVRVPSIKFDCHPIQLRSATFVCRDQRDGRTKCAAGVPREQRFEATGPRLNLRGLWFRPAGPDFGRPPVGRSIPLFSEQNWSGQDGGKLPSVVRIARGHRETIQYFRPAPDC